MARNKTTSPAPKASAGAGKFKRLEAVSVPDFQFENDETEYVKFMTEFVQAKARENDQQPGQRGGRVEAAPRTPPTKGRLVVLETGELVSAIIPAMLRNQLEEAYPDATYVGRCFEVTMYAPARGKQYKTCDVFEIDPETGGETEVGDDAGDGETY